MATAMLKSRFGDGEGLAGVGEQTSQPRFSYFEGGEESYFVPSPQAVGTETGTPVSPARGDFSVAQVVEPRAVPLVLFEGACVPRESRGLVPSRRSSSAANPHPRGM
ncbi:hypothetical protein MAPG_01096 [Magnaporthiopsis poae ATCC 64411]|uniref:Uncharacterized protein n=1 Tax=Magnaporthiopsis poae (strain ATCC 64411 / 73-15) TaxID=644358 RepID=A0A0C4DMT4_MAGP6|nr:hypothetical protein MAPG_01096 [Magnaporthiopsis poae ATCC 64411]